MSFVSGIGGSSNNAAELFGTDKEEQQKETVQERFSKLLKEKQAECMAGIQSGGCEQSFQIGADAYTETEWKKLLAGFDVAQAKLREAAQETNREMQRMETEEKPKGCSMAANAELLLAEYTTATYPSGTPEIPDDVYDTYYTQDGIYCRKRGQDEFQWQILFEDSSQYEKVMSYLQGLDLQNNLRFACHENFWQDFLSGQMDVNKFKDFWEERVVDGVPNYLNVYETGATIDAGAEQYSKYMNLPDFVKNMCYTSEEAFQTFFNHRKVDANKQPGHEVIDTNHLEQYYAKHPNEIGKRNHYYNGRWYSMAELAAVWDKELAELFGQG